MVRKSYLWLAISIFLPFAIVGCADDDKNKQIKQPPQVKVVEPSKKTISIEEQARLDLRRQIASCLQVKEKNMKSLVIAEKPSVARDIARVLHCSQKGNGTLEGKDYVVQDGDIMLFRFNV